MGVQSSLDAVAHVQLPRSQVCSHSPSQHSPAPAVLLVVAVGRERARRGETCSRCRSRNQHVGTHLPAGFHGFSHPPFLHLPSPSLSEEEAAGPVWPWSSINTKERTSSSSQVLLPEAHYRELAVFKSRRRGLSQVLWEYLQSAASKVKCGTAGRAPALGSKRPGFASQHCCRPVLWSKIIPQRLCPCLLIFNRDSFSLANAP